jgi:hypothetical protein
LWSFRQVFASTGQTTQAELLKRVNLRVYPHSKFRSDWMFTQIAGSRTIVPPVTPASAFVWLNRGAIVWILLVLLSTIWMGISQLQASEFTGWGKFLWLLAAIILGPIAILIRVCLHAQSIEEKPAKLCKAWGAAALSITVYATAWSLAIAILISLGDESQPLATLGLTYLVPLLTGVVAVRIPLLVAQVKDKFWQIIKSSLLMEIILFNLGFAVFFPMTMLLSERLLGKLPHPASLFFWPMISIIAIVAVTISTPLQYWMIRREYPLQTGVIANITDEVKLPNLQVTWPALLGTFIVMVTALATTVAQLG